MILYGICKCGRWGIAPPQFDERKQFLTCTCGQKMFLLRQHPRVAGYDDTEQILIVMEDK